MAAWPASEPRRDTVSCAFCEHLWWFAKCAICRRVYCAEHGGGSSMLHSGVTRSMGLCNECAREYEKSGPVSQRWRLRTWPNAYSPVYYMSSFWAREQAKVAGTTNEPLSFREVYEPTSLQHWYGELVNAGTIRRLPSDRPAVRSPLLPKPDVGNPPGWPHKQPPQSLYATVVSHDGGGLPHGCSDKSPYSWYKLLRHTHSQASLST